MEEEAKVAVKGEGKEEETGEDLEEVEMEEEATAEDSEVDLEEVEMEVVAKGVVKGVETGEGLAVARVEVMGEAKMVVEMEEEAAVVEMEEEAAVVGLVADLVETEYTLRWS
jgi:peptidyl-tRNA hydrolase